jgi:hypothetical protein
MYVYIYVCICIQLYIFIDIYESDIYKYIGASAHSDPDNTDKPHPVIPIPRERVLIQPTSPTIAPSGKSVVSNLTNLSYHSDSDSDELDSSEEGTY